LEIKFTPDYNEKEPIFWRVFEELSNTNNGLVDGSLLVEGCREAPQKRIT
jgi:hypothetical protein